MATSSVLTTASTLRCGHAPPPPAPPAPPPPPPAPGTITVLPPVPPRLTVDGTPVLALQPGVVASATVAGCPLVPPSGPACVKVTVLTGAALRLTIDGAPVLVQSTFHATTNGVPPAPATAAAGQTRLLAE